MNILIPVWKLLCPIRLCTLSKRWHSTMFIFPSFFFRWPEFYGLNLSQIVSKLWMHRHNKLKSQTLYLKQKIILSRIYRRHIQSTYWSFSWLQICTVKSLLHSCPFFFYYNVIKNLHKTTTTFLLQISWRVYFFLPIQLSLHRTIKVKDDRKNPPHTVCPSSLCIQEDLKWGQTITTHLFHRVFLLL